MRLIASDLDGTLLISHSEIGEENLKALKYARENGVTFVASTGRTFPGASRVFKDTDFLPDYFISCNGTLIFTGEGEEIRKTPLDKTLATQVLEYLHNNNFSYSVSCEDRMYVIRSSYDIIKNEYENCSSYGTSETTGSLKDFYDLFQPRSGIEAVDSYHDMLKSGKDIFSIICISIDKNRLKEGQEGLKHIEDITLTSSASNNFEIFHKDASKGAALEYLANKINISLDETMAIGDNFNDLPMLEKAKISVAMGNARDGVKEKCSFVTKRNDEHGVAHAIYHFMGAKG
ncbi:MAG: Cof-type HAD-IIB family hydrolase [Clostridium sp.]